ncbi:MAG: hypothetical protein WC346_07875 [Methanogenium sp.]|jgi:sulfur carrier protein ThiS
MKKQDRIKIIIGRFGREPEEVEVPMGSTVEEALKDASVSLGSSEKVWVNSEKASMKDIVEDGDIINIVSPKEAGR